MLGFERKRTNPHEKYDHPALRMPDAVAKLKALGVSPGGGTPDDFVRQIKDDAPVYAEIARTANIRITP